MIPMSQALLLSSYPPARAGVAMALWVMTTLVAPIVGPPLGGWIIRQSELAVDLLHQHSGGRRRHLGDGHACFAAARRATHSCRSTSSAWALLVVWVGSMQIMLDKGRELDWFTAPEIWVLCILAVVGFVVFLIWELTDDHPVVDLSLFRIRNFAIGTSALALAYGLFFGNVVLIPLWLQQYMGIYGHRRRPGAGAGRIPGDAAVAAHRAQHQQARCAPAGQRVLRVLCAGAVDALAASPPTPTSPPSRCRRCCRASPWPACSSRSTPSCCPASAPERLAAASGLSNFVRIAAGAVGTSVTTTLWDNRAHAAPHAAGRADQRLQSDGRAHPGPAAGRWG